MRLPQARVRGIHWPSAPRRCSRRIRCADPRTRILRVTLELDVRDDGKGSPSVGLLSAQQRIPAAAWRVLSGGRGTVTETRRELRVHRKGAFGHGAVHDHGAIAVLNAGPGAGLIRVVDLGERDIRGRPPRHVVDVAGLPGCSVGATGSGVTIIVEGDGSVVRSVEAIDERSGPRCWIPPVAVSVSMSSAPPAVICQLLLPLASQMRN